MSITIGNLINETLNDNRLKINSYFNSNIINLNIEGNSYNDAIINFKNISEFGISNSLISLNYNNFNIFNANNNRSLFSNDLIIKNNFYTSNNFIYMNSNIIFNLSTNLNNKFNIITNNNNILFEATNNNIKINFNNSNKLLIDNTQIKFNDNITINSNYSLIVSNIKSISPLIPIVIDNATFNNLLISTYNVKNSLTIDNDTLYPNQSIFINRYLIDCNIIDIYNKNIIDNSSNRIFSINKSGFIGIGSNIPLYPIDIKINSSNYSNISYIFKYENTSNYNDNFSINNRGFISIGTNISSNQLNINVNDDKRNIINYPIINLNLNYDRNSNYKTSNIIDLKFIATKENIPIYNNEDTLIGFSEYQYDNFLSKIVNSSNIINSGEFVNTTVEISILNTINNDYINNFNISNLINYTTFNYIPYTITDNNVDYFINYTIKYPSFLLIDNNNIPSITIDTNNNYHHYITFTSYVVKEGTLLPIIDVSNLILKEFKKRIYIFNPNDLNSFSIFLIQKLYIEKNTYILKSFIDTINYTYQPPPHFLYGTSNNNFSVLLSSDGKLSLGDIDDTFNYQLYVNKKTRLNNLECANISSVYGKNNINFSFCNISNINKSFTYSNITSNLIADNSIIKNSFNSNLFSSNIITNNINISNLNYTNIYGSNFTITSNLLNPNIKTIFGNNIIPNLNNYFININVNNDNSNGLAVQSFNSNINPLIAINGISTNTYPYLIMSNLTSSYSININNNNKNYLNFDNFSLIDNKNNIIIFKHINYNDNINNQFIIGSNNIIFDLKLENIPNNTTNKISLGFPYRFLMQNNYNVNNWEYYFKQNTLNNDAMLNVYGNVNLSTINNTPFIKCIATEYPNENISINTAGAQSRDNSVFNVNGNSYFSSNINVDNDIYIKGTIGNVSDIRIKENLIKIKNSIDKIEQINGYIYKRKDTGKFETGLVAQEVIKILPEVVNINFDNQNNYYNISYGNMVGLLVEGIKELNLRLKNIEQHLLISSNL